MMSLDSLKRAQLKSILEQYYGAEVEPEFLFDVNTTFDALVQKIDVCGGRTINMQAQQNRKPIIREVTMTMDEGDGETSKPVNQYTPPERTFCQKFCCQIR